MSETPRTDAACVSREYIAREMDYYTQKFVLADFARQLERELSALAEGVSGDAAAQEVMVPVRFLVFSLEGSSANTDTDWRWRAAEALRECPHWQSQEITLHLPAPSGGHTTASEQEGEA